MPPSGLPAPLQSGYRHHHCHTADTQTNTGHERLILSVMILGNTPTRISILSLFYFYWVCTNTPLSHHLLVNHFCLSKTTHSTHTHTHFRAHPEGSGQELLYTAEPRDGRHTQTDQPEVHGVILQSTRTHGVIHLTYRTPSERGKLIHIWELLYNISLWQGGMVFISSLPNGKIFNI